MVKITKNALEHLKHQGTYIVISVNNKGCSGHSYDIYVTNALTESLELVEGNVYIDSRHKDILNGSVVDYTKDGFFSRISILNPNEQSRCGCGESFA